MAERSRHPPDAQADLDGANRYARRRAERAKPLREAYLGAQCRTLFPELLLAGVPEAALVSLGDGAAARAHEAPTMVNWLAALIAGELSRRVDAAWRRLPVVAPPQIPSDEGAQSLQLLGELFLRFDSRSPETAPGAAEVADLLAAITSMVSGNPA